VVDVGDDAEVPDDRGIGAARWRRRGLGGHRRLSRYDVRVESLFHAIPPLDETPWPVPARFREDC
jgi:hypothetical protein